MAKKNSGYKQKVDRELQLTEQIRVMSEESHLSLGLRNHGEAPYRSLFTSNFLVVSPSSPVSGA